METQDENEYVDFDFEPVDDELEGRKKYIPKARNLFEYCTSVYAVMEDESEYDTEESERSWKGSLVLLIEQLGIGKANYTRTMNALRGMGCISLRYRGGGPALSEYWVHHPPTQERFDKARNDGLFSSSKVKHVEMAQADLNKEMDALKQNMAVIAKALKNLTDRVDGLETHKEDMETSMIEENEWVTFDE